MTVTRFLLLSACFSFCFLNFSTKSNAQCSSCDTNVTEVNVDLSANADTIWTVTGFSRANYCCGAGGTLRCIRFNVLVHPDADILSFDVFNPAPPGGAVYMVDCGSTILLGDTLCIIGLDSFCLTFCKSGTDIPDYYIMTATNQLSSATSVTNATCPGGSDGTATVTANGGTPPYTYSWTTVPIQTGATATGLSAGIRLVQVEDANGCTVNDTVVIGEPSPITVNYAVLPPTCYNGCNGAAIASASGGTPPYLYNGQTDSIALGLCAGFYPAVVTDGNGCSESGIIVVTQPPQIQLTITTTDANCGQSDGSASVVASNGTPPYSYQWSSGDTTALADSIGSGIYIVAVLDSNGCNNIGAAMVSDVGGPTITVNSVTNNVCNGDALGQILITVTGGATPYTYSWSNGASTEDISSLPSGPYEVVVEDASGCSAMKSIPVLQPNEMLLEITEVFPTCGSADGTATVSPSGGTAPYTYNWSTGGNDTTITGLIWGVYDVTVTDANGCIAIDYAALGEQGGTVVTIDSVLDADCGSQGGIYVTVTGGAPPYVYMWTDSVGMVDSVEDLTNAPSGTYDLIITDTNGCMGAANATIEAVMSTPDPICLVTVDSITGTNLVVWEKNLSVGAASFNIYKESTQLDVYYLVGNVPYDSLSEFVDTVSDPMFRSWRYKIAVVDSCGNESDLSADHKTIHLTVNAGLSSTINLIWDHYEGITFSTYYISRYTPSTGWLLIDSLPSNLTSLTDTPPTLVNLLYNVSVNHPDGCEATKVKNFNSAKSNTSSYGQESTSTLAMATSATDATTGNCDGTATATPSGGAPPYTYSWSDPQFQSTATATGLCVGSYIITLTDSTGNVITDTVTVGSTTPPGFDENQTSEAIKIYPNPNSGRFSLHITKPVNISSITIYNMVGQEVGFKTNSTLPQKLDLEVFSTPGIYYVKIQTDEGPTIRKIIIE